MDDVLRDYCPFTYYQKRLTFVVSLTSLISAPHTAVLVFIGSSPSWYCSQAGSNTSRALTESVRCEHLANHACSPVYDRSSGTITAEFGLICERQSDSNYAQSLYFVGMLLGSLLAGWFSDRYGRRAALLLGILVSLIGAVWSTLSTGFISFAISRLLVGLGCMCNGVASIILLSESVAMAYRGFTTTMTNVFFGIGLVFLPLQAYILHDSWRELLALLTLGIVILQFTTWMWVSESPFWLLTNNKHAELEAMFTRWAASSGKALPERLISNLSVSKEKLLVADDESPRVVSRSSNVSLLSLLSRHMISYSLLWSWTWFTVCLMYYGLTLHMEGVGSNKYISFCLMAAVEFPSLVVVMVVLRYFGRRTCVFWFMVATTIFCAMSATIAQKSAGHDDKDQPGPVNLTMANLQLFVSICGKFTASAAFSILYTFTPELLPTSIRTSGLGVCAVVSRFGAIISPFVLALAHRHPAFPYILFTLCGVVACFGCYRMPETKNKELPETLQDLQRLFASGG